MRNGSMKGRGARAGLRPTPCAFIQVNEQLKRLIRRDPVSSN
jgi:hypothetical protein